MERPVSWKGTLMLSRVTKCRTGILSPFLGMSHNESLE